MYINGKIERAKDTQQQETEKFIRLNGWTYETIGPGSCWLWCKIIKSVKYAVNQDTAIWMISHDWDNKPKGLDPEAYEEDE